MYCRLHDEECTGTCGWCSKPICDECVADAAGKKYCSECRERMKVKKKPATGGFGFTSVDKM